jgi:hypothetical protein
MVLRIILIVSLYLGFSLGLTGQTVYTTATGEKYHRSDCRYLARSKYQATL